MSSIQDTIRRYLQDKKEPTIFDLKCFVGMIETGEAIIEDFYIVGGNNLVNAVERYLEK